MFATPSRLLSLSAVVFSLCVAACGNGATTTSTPEEDAGPDTKFGIDGKITKDVPLMTVDVGSDAPNDVATDVQPASDVLAVLPDMPTSVVMGATATVTLHIDHGQAPDGPPLANEAVTWTVNGTELAVGAVIAPAGTPQPNVAIWKGADAGTYLLAGVRPGTATVKVTVGGVPSAEVQVPVIWPTTPTLAVSTPTLHGEGVAKRMAEPVADTARVETKLFEPGGLDAQVRFPIAGTVGATLDLTAPPPAGALAITATIVSPDKLNKPTNPVVGALWVHQLDKGWIRGSFLGRTTDQTPVVGAFQIERDGTFGIDIQDTAQQIEASSADTPISNTHVSRVSINPVGGNMALLTYRRVANAAQAELVRVLINAKTGEIDKTLPPLVTGAKAYVDPPSDPPVFDPAIGYVAAGVSSGQTLVVWEGKKGKNVGGVPAEVGLWAQQQLADGSLATTGVFSGGPIQITADPCMGGCNPQVVPLPGSRFLVVWSLPEGGIFGRRLEGDFTFSDTAATTFIQAPATQASAVAFDKTVALAWLDPDTGGNVRIYVANNKSLVSQNSPALIGPKTPQAPAPAVGIFGGGAPGLLGFGVTGDPAIALQMRRFDFSGTAVNMAPTNLGNNIDAVHVASGKNGQVVVVDRTANAKMDPLHVRKFFTATAIDPGTQLGPTETLGAVVKYAPVFGIAYIPDADTYVVAWSGDESSQGVWFQRFR